MNTEFQNRYDSPIKEVVWGGHMAIVRLLVSRGAIFEIDGRSALYAAAVKGYEAIARLFLGRDAEINAGIDIDKDCYGYGSTLQAAV